MTVISSGGAGGGWTDGAGRSTTGGTGATGAGNGRGSTNSTANMNAVSYGSGGGGVGGFDVSGIVAGNGKAGIVIVRYAA